MTTSDTSAARAKTRGHGKAKWWVAGGPQAPKTERTGGQLRFIFFGPKMERFLRSCSFTIPVRTCSPVQKPVTPLALGWPAFWAHLLRGLFPREGNIARDGARRRPHLTRWVLCDESICLASMYSSEVSRACINLHVRVGHYAN